MSTVPAKRPNYGALAGVDPAPILAKLESGYSLRQLAKDLHVSNVALRAWLLREDREQYRDAVTAALAQRVAEADELLDSADDQISIARAREQARFSRMDLERRRPGLYGVRAQSIAVNSAGPVQVIVQDSYATSAQAADSDPENLPRGPYDLLQDKSAEDGGG